MIGAGGLWNLSAESRWNLGQYYKSLCYFMSTSNTIWEIVIKKGVRVKGSWPTYSQFSSYLMYLFKDQTQSAVLKICVWPVGSYPWFIRRSQINLVNTCEFHSFPYKRIDSQRSATLLRTYVCDSWMCWCFLHIWVYIPTQRWQIFSGRGPSATWIVHVQEQSTDCIHPSRRTCDVSHAVTSSYHLH